MSDPVDGLRELTAQERAFVDAYLETGSASAAYRAAYDTSGTAENTIWRKAHVVSHRPSVAAEIERRMAEAALRADVSRDRIVAELAKIAFSSIRQTVRWTETGVALIPSEEIEDDAAAAVAEVSEGKDGIRIKRHDKVRALELLGRHLQMWNDADVSVPITLHVTDYGKPDG